MAHVSASTEFLQAVHHRRTLSARLKAMGLGGIGEVNGKEREIEEPSDDEGRHKLAVILRESNTRLEREMKKVVDRQDKLDEWLE